jgi:transcriptional regulator with XRE-family HTH domain
MRKKQPEGGYFMYGAAIRKYLDGNGIKYSYVAEKIGVNLSTLSTMLSGVRKISIDEYFDICDLLKIDPVGFREQIKPEETP